MSIYEESGFSSPEELEAALAAASAELSSTHARLKAVEYKWYNKYVQKIQNKNVQMLYCYLGGKQYDFKKQHYCRFRN